MKLDPNGLMKQLKSTKKDAAQSCRRRMGSSHGELTIHAAGNSTRHGVAIEDGEGLGRVGTHSGRNIDTARRRTRNMPGSKQRRSQVTNT